MNAVFAMPGDSEGALLLARIDERTARSEKLVVALHETIRGDGMDTGLVGMAIANREAIKGIHKEMDDIRAQLALKMFPQKDEASTIKARAEAWALRVGATAGILTAMLEAYARLFGG